MTCEQALETISAALDNELSDAEKEELEAHLTSCPDCRALWEDLRTIQEDAWESALEPPEGFHDRVMAAVAEEPAVRAGLPKKRHAWKGWGGLAAVAAVAILIAGPGLRSGMSGSGGNDEAAPAMAEVLSDEAMGDAQEEPAVPEGQSESEDVGMYDTSMSELGAALTGRAAPDRNESTAAPEQAPEEEAPQGQMQAFTANKFAEGDTQIKKRAANLLSVKSIVTLALTAVFAYMACTNQISQDFMTIYAVIIAFYFGTQSQKVQDAVSKLDAGEQ